MDQRGRPSKTRGKRFKEKDFVTQTHIHIRA